jgi:hypothetical protein
MPRLLCGLGDLRPIEKPLTFLVAQPPEEFEVVLMDGVQADVDRRSHTQF